MGKVHEQRYRGTGTNLMSPYETLLGELAATLRGPRRSRQRLLDEIREDMRDAIEFETSGGLAPDAAEALVAARFGSPAAIATRWNSDQELRRHATRRNTLVVVLAMAMAGALGITQYAAGTNSPTPTRCTNTSRVASAVKTSDMCQKELEKRHENAERSP
jgi:hypothetical protein